ncbi:Ribosomal RNA small subunit methyltransferase G [Kluyvera cryocrescens]|uniref:Ribosomal RNA small subunit methyltransferase G n=1 Tax=Kluyvera cryocrescens TaxID=580 RepID=A0A485B4A0_KLUCR|nr:Ribosomal RNA small subunit methyltransferase G [Kluyvera cryocrescens]
MKQEFRSPITRKISLWRTWICCTSGNKAYNLTSRSRSQRNAESATFSTASWFAPSLKGERFIDVGTGPGLPGIPLSIVRPDAHFTLLDSLGKRVRFLRQVQHELKLENITPGTKPR